MSNPVPAWKPGSFSTSTAAASAAGPSRTININHLPQKDTFERIQRLNNGRQMVKDFKKQQT